MLTRETFRRLFHDVLFVPRSVQLQAWSLRALAGVFGRPSAAAATHAERIVVVKLDRIGDFVLLTPFLRELRRNRPQSWITLVVSDVVHPLAAPCPYVNAVIGARRQAPGLRGSWHHWTDWMRLAWRQLLPLRPTLALLPRWEIDLYDAYALLAFTGAIRRISYSTEATPEKAARNRGADRLLTEAIHQAPGRHEVQKNLGLLRVLGFDIVDDREELWPAADPGLLRARLIPAQSGHRLIALCPHSTEETKDWPFDRFLEVVRRFSARLDITFLLFAGPEHAAFSELPTARALPGLISLAGRLTLDETTALLTQCEIVLTVDTGLMHLAGALRRPLVVVNRWPEDADPDSHYSAARFGPWRADCTLITPPAGTRGPRAIDAIGVDEVVAAMEARLVVT